MAGATPEIKTRFTLDGMQQAVGKLRSFGQAVLRQFDSVRSTTGKTFEPFVKGVKSAEDKVKQLGKETAKVGGVTAFKGIKIGALSAAAGVSVLALKISAIGAAAVKASRDSAESLNEIGIQAKRISASPEDISVLKLAADRTGTDLDEVVTQIATISNEFLTVRESIGKADAAYQQFIGNTARDVAILSGRGDKQGIISAITGFDATALEERKKSLTEIERRIAEIDVASNVMYSNFDATNQRSAFNQYVGDTDRLNERQQLLAARDQIKQGFSPQGQALFTLQDYGLDIGRATKGGVDSLYAISEAFQKIQDPSERSRVAMRLFGEDAGVKLIPLLAGGRKAIDDYRKDLERFGGVVTKDDLARGAAYKKSMQDLQAARGGVEQEIGRQLQPMFTQTNIQITNWLVKSRGAIATYAKDAFVALKTFAEDAVSIFRGDTSTIKTQWLDTVVKKTAMLRDVWADVRLQIALLMSGQDSDYKWVNTIRDYLLQVKAFALDAWSVITGGDAKEFPFLNGLRDQVKTFVVEFSKAWDMFKGFLGGIHDVMSVVLKPFGIDPTTMALFLGIARFTGVLGGVTAAVKLVTGAFGGLFTLGGGALAAGAGVARAGAALGGAAATAGGFTSSLLGIQTALGGIARAAGVMGAAIAGGFMLGQKAAEQFQKFTGTQALQDQVIDAQTKLMRNQGDQYMNMRLGRREERDYRTMRAYYGNKSGQDYSWLKTSAEQAVATQQKLDQLVWGKPMFSGPDAEAQYRANQPEIFTRQQPPVSRRVQVDLNVGGLQYPVFADESTADGLTSTLESFNRR
ncbi:hypothetical protein [Rhizobium leguminosarum]|uniref:hypothetical protein n=1 Tax=Rhizobium leguminosarum TaxID=384 RepID=UPI001441036E|nr:hypothetical protein [Rhizobium leguminosarum]NKL63294.1 hypothetical protein [Rhizobium leguminosarum bv. viciae]